MTLLEEAFVQELLDAGLPEPQREFRFHPVRKWRFDFCWPEQMVAVEIEGATWAGGRHVRGAGYEKDAEKYNEATRMGFKVYRFTSGMVQDGRAIDTMRKVMGT